MFKSSTRIIRSIAPSFSNIYSSGSRSFNTSQIVFAKKSKKGAEINKARLEKIQKEKESAEQLKKLKDTPFLNSLLKANEIFKSTVSPSYADSAATRSSQVLGEIEGSKAHENVFLGNITSEEADLVLNNAPDASIDFTMRNKVSLIDSNQINLAKTQSEISRRVISVSNQNAKAVLNHNIQLAIKHFARTEGDTASPEVQAAVFTVRIIQLADHLRHSNKDHSNRRIYTQFLHKRAKILRYLKRESLDRYFICLKELGLTQEMVEGQILFPKRVD
ncbi:putative 37S ribosomal protein S28, mitochondrial [Smittium culicis]|uniref:Putative 37S ribosomal protein S28, mitochondrial n=1 Tax=Smittium culicis TaxID=133412 RepID=A0A1R1XZG7_9FUNG|nr:putative 37S ribosomal protein S28, mitochondrial [Smittium culicis]